jgi:hypothetical protein
LFCVGSCVNSVLFVPWPVIRCVCVYLSVLSLVSHALCKNVFSFLFLMCTWCTVTLSLYPKLLLLYLISMLVKIISFTTCMCMSENSIPIP